MDDDPLIQNRLASHWPVLEARIRRVYGANAGPLLARLLGRLQEAAENRPAALREIDGDRTRHPNWTAQSGNPVYTFYVDRFANDLAGVRERLDYLQKLGVKWLHPLPLLRARPGDSDGGFAVADYRQVEPHLGTMTDLRDLASDLRCRGMGLLLDVVCNHTAQEHQWAQEAMDGDRVFQDYYHLVRTPDEVQSWERDLVDVFPDTAPGSFTYVPGLNAHVWTTFYPFQWDLNYANPDVFYEMLDVLIHLSEQGVDGFRLDSAPFLWKRAGTNCRNQPEAHLIVEAWRAALSIVAPGVVLLAEAIESLEDVLPFFGDEAPGCNLAYNNGVMTALWGALADEDAGIARTVLTAAAARPDHAAWLNYVRCHDDLIWNAVAAYAPLADLKRWSEFYDGNSFSDGRAFQTAAGGVPSTNGMASALVGLNKAGVDQDEALARLSLLYGVTFGLDGWPLIYMGDEVGLANDPTWDTDSNRKGDGRWLHRPTMDWDRAQDHSAAGSTICRIFSSMRRLADAATELNRMDVRGRAQPIDLGIPAVLAFERSAGTSPLLVVANFSSKRKSAPLPLRFARGSIDLLTGRLERRDAVALAPYDVAWLIPRS